MLPQKGDARRARKLEALAQYGNRCALCGEATPEALHLHHPDNDGPEHRKEITGNPMRGGDDFIRFLKYLGWPRDRRLQVLSGVVTSLFMDLPCVRCGASGKGLVTSHHCSGRRCANAAYWERHREEINQKRRKKKA